MLGIGLVLGLGLGLGYGLGLVIFFIVSWLFEVLCFENLGLT